MQRLSGLRAWAAALALVAGGVPIAAAGARDGAAPTQPHSCRIAGIRNDVVCGSVRRPLDPARPAGPQIDIHYMLVPALAQRKRPDPIVVLAGGPGQSAIAVSSAVLPLYDRLNNLHDIVFVDQRGTGRSAPLACDDAEQPSIAAEADPDRQTAQLRRCLARLEALPAWTDRHGTAAGGGLDPADALRHFTTPIAVQDLDAVRRALGARRVDLVGASYGTRVALEMLRQFPESVGRVVLDGVAPADMALPQSLSIDNQRALDGWLDACAAEPACSRAHPALRRTWTTLQGRLPAVIMVDNPLTGAPETLTLTRDALLAAVRGPLYVPALAAGLPQAIDEAAQGRWRGLVGLSGLVAPRQETALAMGMHFSVVCAEDMPRPDEVNPARNAAPERATATDFGSDLSRFYERVCAFWPRGTLPPGYTDIPTSASAVLLLSGSLDPATPPRHAERVARMLGPLARSIVVPNAGHGVLGIGCLRDVLFRFIDAASDADALRVDARCAAGLPRPPAFRPIAAAVTAATAADTAPSAAR